MYRCKELHSTGVVE